MFWIESCAKQQIQTNDLPKKRASAQIGIKQHSMAAHKSLETKTIIYCVTDRQPITQSWRSVLNFKISVLTFLRLISCLMSIGQVWCKDKIFLLQSMSNAIRCIDKRFAFKNSGISCLAWAIQEQQCWTQEISSKLLDTTSHILFFLINWYEPMAWLLRQVAVSLATWD